MNRVQFLMQGLDVNEVQASLVSELIKDVPNEALKDFLVFRMQFIEPYKSKEAVTKEALFEYQKRMFLKRLQAGEILFKTVGEIKQFIETYFKGQDIGNGLASFYDYVVIGLDKDCNLVNKYFAPDGRPKKLTGDEVNEVYKFLLDNQHRIGAVDYIEEREVKKLERIESNEKKELPVAKDVAGMVAKTIKKM